MKSILATATLFLSVAVFVQAQWQPLPSGGISRVAFGSCAKHWQAQPIWNAIIQKKPDLFLFLGDNIYADTDGKSAWSVTEQSLRGEWNRLADKPEFQAAQAAFPFLATWDNLGYGTHNGGAEYPLKLQSKAVFLDFFGEAPEAARRSHSGIYDAKVIGPEGQRVQVILLDTRYYKGAFIKGTMGKEAAKERKVVGKYALNTDTSVTLLGEKQWQWLDAELKKPAKLRLVCSSSQVIRDEKGMDEWGNYPHECARLLQLLSTTKGSKTILLSGNAHFTEISESKKFGGLLEFTSSGMTHTNPY
ncbi:alkaline phosphatase D family protein [Rubritalea profundi]|uniref:PhoD-like phosphatase metallophosphatase domain-containing protein n=1 Tax=Rubritalea profundi TaxID=1658618 RepID=A0A2S7U2E3_9BACT|nr:alkaline phosphatase D family protein [Rubritalea profundi]PQJ28353.1 hypothetical protein BSZ32_07390 [Rubritalea profundi]